MTQTKKFLKTGLKFENSNLPIVSDFDIRISDLFSGVPFMANAFHSAFRIPNSAFH